MKALNEIFEILNEKYECNNRLQILEITSIRSVYEKKPIHACIAICDKGYLIIRYYNKDCYFTWMNENREEAVNIYNHITTLMQITKNN